MKSCPEYHNLIDRDGDLDATQKGNLEAHLASCAGCTEYKANVDRTLHLLHALRKHATPTDLDQAFEQLSSRLAASKRQMAWALVLVALCVAAPFAALSFGDFPRKNWAPFAAALAAAIVAAWQIHRGQSSLHSLTQRAGGFFATWRQDLKSRIRLLTGGGVLAVFSCLAFLSWSMLGPFGIVERLVVLCAALLTAFAALHTFIVELPQLRGEQRLVQDASGG
jgi:cation transport ATPase